MIGDQFLVRGYEDGKNFMIREKYSPTLFVPSKKKTYYRTLTGEYVEPIKPGGVRDCREFIKKYDGVENFSIYGNERYVYQYISDNYREDEIKFDISKIKLTTIDIEVASDNGFPKVEDSIEELTDKVYANCYKSYQAKSTAIAQQAYPVIKDVFENQSATYENIVIPFI